MLAFYFWRRYLFSGRAGSLIRLISWISLLGVTVGVMSLIVVVSVMSGFHAVIRGRLLGLEPHLTITLPPKSSAATLDDFSNKIKAEKISEFVVVDSQDLIVRTLDGTFSGGVARGYLTEELDAFLKRTDQLNRENAAREENAKSRIRKQEDIIPSFIPQAVKLKEREVVLGSDLARSLGVLEGDQVLLIPPEGLLIAKGEVPLYERVTVVSRISTRVTDLDSKLVLFDNSKTLTRMKLSPSREKLIEVRLDDPNQSENLKLKLTKLMPNAAIQTWQDRNQALFFALKMEKLVMTIFLSLSGLITSFSIVSVLSLLVSQKRKEIGLMLAMGLSPRRIQRIYVGIGFFLSFNGIALGLLLGLLLCELIDRYPIPLLPDIYYDSTIPVLVTKDLVFLVSGLSFVVALMSAFLPARGLSKLTASETFRIPR